MDLSSYLAGWRDRLFGDAIPLTTPFLVLMLLAAGVSLLIGVLVAYSVVRHRGRAGRGEPRQVHGNRNLEIAWTAVPALVLVALFGFLVRSMLTQPTAGTDLPAERAPDIVVTGNQWWWEFYYPASGVVTANEMHLPAGRRVLVQLKAEDVIHDFWIPQLGPKMDMVPGHPNYTWLEAPEPGVYNGACAEFCGVQHAWMRIYAVAQPPGEFDAWIRDQLESSPPPLTPLAQRGKEIFLGRTPEARTCASCHAIRGTPANGQAGPELTDFGNRVTISAGVMRNTPHNLALYLRNPQAVKPGIYMPNFRLSEAEIAALTAYLESLR
jgi:cytochrome c oxidase subunit 2